MFDFTNFTDKEKFIFIYVWTNTTYPDWTSEIRTSFVDSICQHFCPDLSIKDKLKILSDIADFFIEFQILVTHLEKKFTP